MQANQQRGEVNLAAPNKNYTLALGVNAESRMGRFLMRSGLNK